MAISPVNLKGMHTSYLILTVASIRFSLTPGVRKILWASTALSILLPLVLLSLPAWSGNLAETHTSDEETDAAVQSIALEAANKPIPAHGAEISTEKDRLAAVGMMCRKIGAKLGSVNETACVAQNLTLSPGVSVQGNPILIKEYPPNPNRQPQARILLIGGIHGDEYSSISIVFKWMETLNKHHSGLFYWRIAPLVNPDGFFQTNAQRYNHRGVDLNRNFPTADTDEEWLTESLEYWKGRPHKDPRRFPGSAPLSEPESRWIAAEIDQFKPNAVVSIHAPFGLLDFDGPPNTPPERLGQLYLSPLGTYPGSLGRYVGGTKKIPIITIELKSAGIMPSEEEIRTIWMDLVNWLQGHVFD